MKKLSLAFLCCICLSFIASDCQDVKQITQNNNPGGTAGGLILYTSNSGHNWIEGNGAEYKNITHIKHFALDIETFNVVAKNENGNSFTLKTQNYGQNWTSMTGTIDQINITDIYAGFFGANQKGFIVGVPRLTGLSGIYMTADSGSSWSEVENVPADIKDISLHCIDFDEYSGLGIIIPARDDSILVTSDGGLNWLHRAPVNHDIFDIEIIEDSFAIACGREGKILTTSNLGRSWTQITSPVFSDLYSISMYDQKGIIVGVNGTILKTDNWGLNWVSITGVTSSTLNKVITASPESWACGDGIIIKSVNFGNSWDIMRSSSQEVFNDMSFVDFLYGEGVFVGYRK